MTARLVSCLSDVGQCRAIRQLRQLPFRRAVTKLDVPRIGLHDLRHTHASILLQQGINAKVVSERLGHSSVAFTMTVYQHVMPGMQAQAAATFGAAVFGDR